MNMTMTLVVAALVGFILGYILLRHTANQARARRKKHVDTPRGEM